MNKEFLRALLEIASPSGYEKNAAGLWKKEAEKFADLVYGDIHGNSIAKIANDEIPFPARIMLAGHIDEIGLIVSYIDPEGFIYFQTIGGWDPQVLVGQRVQILIKDGQIAVGCIGRKPIHQLSEEARKQVVKIEDLWIDVGSKEHAELISVGDCAVIDYAPLLFQLTRDKFAARGIDDRIGAFVVLEALRLIKKEKLTEAVYAVATVQEEIGLRGAITSAYGINPQIGIAVDVTFATDFPGANKKEADIKLGKGPVIAIGPNITPAIYESLVKTAKENSIPYQIEAKSRGTGTDANVIQLSRGGVATGLVSIPNRYMHSPCEMIDLKDVKNAIKLLARFCEKNIGSLLKSE